MTKRHTTLVIAALFMAVALSFGCSDSGTDETPPVTPSIGAEGGACKDDGSCNTGLDCNTKTKICEKSAITGCSPACSEGFECKENKCVAVEPTDCPDGCPDGQECKDNKCVAISSVAGEKKAFIVGDVTFNMAYIPGGLTFKTGTDDKGSATVEDAYWIGETEVTYQLWKKVYDWATTQSGANKYTFANKGREGHDGTVGAATTAAKQEPVTTVNWRDAMVFMNALTEWYNAKAGTSYDCVYYSDADFTTPIRSSAGGSYSSKVNTTAGSFDNPYVKDSAKGFRLPTSNEWELAARYKDGTNWTPGDYASGAAANYKNEVATAAVAVYNIGKTAAVKSKTANKLGLYDMSGNVWEWNFDWSPYYVNEERVWRGGGADMGDENVQVGYVSDCDPFGWTNYVYNGFRLSRTE